jgi:hypothetical protein
MPVICPTCQLAFEASMPAACYFAWGCFRYLGARIFEGEFSNVTRSYAGAVREFDRPDPLVVILRHHKTQPDRSSTGRGPQRYARRWCATPRPMSFRSRRRALRFFSWPPILIACRLNSRPLTTNPAPSAKMQRAMGVDLTKLTATISGSVRIASTVSLSTWTLLNAVGQTRFLEPLRNEKKRESIALGGFQDKDVSACEDDGEHPHRHHCGEIEGDDPPLRLPKRVTIDPRSGVLSEFTFEKLRRSRGELHDFHTALDSPSASEEGARPPVAAVARSYKRLPFVIDRLGGER